MERRCGKLVDTTFLTLFSAAKWVNGGPGVRRRGVCRPGKRRFPAGAAPSRAVQHSLEDQPDADHEAEGASDEAEKQPGTDGAFLCHVSKHL